MIKIYRAARRRTASLLNGFLLSGFGLKVVRSIPRSFQYSKRGQRNGISSVLVKTSAGEQAEIQLREGTSDWLTFDQVIIDEDYDLRPLGRAAELRQVYDDICRVGTPLIIDLGANIGLSALYFSMIWPKAKVVAVEPSAGNMELLRTNTASRPQIDALLAGAASSDTKLSIRDLSAPKNAFSTRAAEEDETGAIDGISVGSLLDSYPEEQGFFPFIVKVDIEGAEAELFSRNVDWVDKFPLLVIELHDWMLPRQLTSANFLKTISAFNRDFVYVDENVFSIKNARPA